MNYSYQVYLRAYAPALIAAVASLVLAKVLGGLAASPFLGALFDVWKWAPVVLFSGALGYGGWVTYRLWQASNGAGPLCACGGPLGHEREGRASRGGAYRSCYACGRNINHRRYE